MNKLILTLPLMIMSFAAWASQPGDKLKAQGICLDSKSTRTVGEAIVNDESVADATDAMVKVGKCTLLPMPIEVTLDEVVDRVHGTNGRPDLLIWKIKDQNGRVFYGLEIDTSLDD